MTVLENDGSQQHAALNPLVLRRFRILRSDLLHHDRHLYAVSRLVDLLRYRGYCQNQHKRGEESEPHEDPSGCFGRVRASPGRHAPLELVRIARYGPGHSVGRALRMASVSTQVVMNPPFRSSSNMGSRAIFPFSASPAVTNSCGPTLDSHPATNPVSFSSDPEAAP